MITVNQLIWKLNDFLKMNPSLGNLPIAYFIDDEGNQLNLVKYEAELAQVNTLKKVLQQESEDN